MFEKEYLIKFCLVLFSTLFFIEKTEAQSDEKLIQLSGIVIEEATATAIPYVNIFVKGSNRGTMSAYNGFFSIIVQPGDTLFFSSIGFKRKQYLVPDTLKNIRESIIVPLTIDTVQLEEAIVYPWPTREQFKEAFISMKVQEDKQREQFTRAGFVYLDTIYPFQPSPVWNPVSFFYENVVKEIQDRKVKRKKAQELPKFD